jgi:hypothetical protein
MARTWTDSTGKYTVEAELIASNGEFVVLKRENSELVSVPVAKLSAEDRQYLTAHEASHAEEKDSGKHQVWTMRSGLKVIGKIVDYARREVTVHRRRGKIYVNDRQLENLPAVYQQMLPKVVSYLENIELKDQKDFEKWVLDQKGKPRTFTLDGVLLELENGDEYLVPFFFFSVEDRELLEPGWHRWLAALKLSEAEKERERQSFLLQSAAKAYQQDERAKQQIAMMHLDLLAVAGGVTDLWEVLLLPPQGTHHSPVSVVVPARDSRAATVQALQKFPGYMAGPARRVNRR